MYPNKNTLTEEKRQPQKQKTFSSKGETNWDTKTKEKKNLSFPDPLTLAFGMGG